MKAVNLIPSDAQRSGGAALKLAPATYGLLGVLAAAVVLVTLYVVSSNSVTSRQAQITSLRAQVAQAQNEASQLNTYASFVQAAQQRVQTVQGIADTRFDWHNALSELAQVVPGNTSLQSLNATVVPGAGNSGGGSGLRTDLPGPAFELTGCTSTQDDVASLISRLRAIPDVTRVALSSTTKTAASAPGASTSAANAIGCAGNSPTFQLVVFFNPVSGAGPDGATSAGTATSTSTSTSSTGGAS